ncbi:MAG: hypothetical protein HN348_11195 [Proteobacteria bacterium]|nr:hypothetical protein [Pseudomonadota bacterium]
MRSLQMFVLCALLLGWTACTGKKDTDVPVDTDDDSPGACGDVSTWDIWIRARVVQNNASVSGADLWLVDRGWEPGTILGQGVTGNNGRVEFEAKDVTSVEDCWGTLLDYYLVAEKGDATGEKGVNTYLHSAIDSGQQADITAFPVEISSP